MCRDRVKLNNDDGEARAEAMDIFPKDSKIALWNSVTLVNASDGTALYSDRLELFRDENAGSATAKKGGKVRLEIAEKTVSGVAGAEFGAKEKGKTGKSGGREGSAPSVVASRALFFARNADGAKFSFDRDVSIRSQSMKGTCNKMNVYSKSRKDNSSRIVKVEAFGDVRMSQNEYSAFAEEAVVYPKDQDIPADKAHKFVELLTSKDKPQKRPRILLPPVKNLGFDGENVRAPKNVKMTVVESDRQRLVSEGKILCASTAAGPALEGACIECGVGGVKGAVNRVLCEDGKLTYSTIGNAPPVGLCGCGLVDFVACLLERGDLDETGYLEEEKVSLTPEVWLSQADIRQYQLAKSAVCAGMRALICKAGLREEDVSRLLIAGGLGYYIDAESAARTGLIPSGLKTRAEAVGNGSLYGAYLVLTDDKCRAEAREIAARCETVDLSSDAVFNDEFIQGMMFE